MFVRLFLLAVLLLPEAVRCQPVPVGHWREHLPWRHATGLAPAADRVYCSTPYGVFAVSFTDQAITRYSKVNGLHEGSVAAIGAHEASGALVIAYANGNLDVLRNETAVNIPELMLSPIPGDKRTREIVFSGHLACLATGAGIVVINLERMEIADSWRIGATASLTYDALYFYAATANGILRAPRQAINLADPANWELMPHWGNARRLVTVNSQLLALQQDTLFLLRPGGRDTWFANGAPISAVNVSGASLFVSQPGRVVQLSADAAPIASLPCQAPVAAIAAGEAAWVADEQNGLLRFTGGTSVNYTPNAPYGIVTGEMLVHNGALWAAAGGVTPGWQGAANTDGVFVFDQEEWRRLPNPDSLRDVVCLSPAGTEMYAGAFGGGLLATGSNTLIKPGGDSLVSGLATDAEGRLWVSTYGAVNNLHVRKPDNSWVHLSIPLFHTGRAVSQLLVDGADQKWIVSPRGNGVFVLNHGAAPEGTADDRWKQYLPGAGQGNLPSADVRCLAKDRNGYIWIGTTRGVAVVQCPGTFCDAYWPVLKEDNFAGYLFQNEQVNAIAVDGADRKWVGTQNGVWLVAPGGEKILEHFNTGNSPLPSNIIHRIAVHPVSGEVFFATAAGLLSWRGTATEGSPTQQKNDVLVFPNPVPHAWEGTIAIRGLVQNAIVKITDTAGRLVFQTRANGGQAVWNGRDYTGRRPQSGVYLVFSVDDSGQEKMVTKLVFIH
jgi:hypothetical protein